MDIERFQAEPPQRNVRMKNIAIRDGHKVHITIPQDPAAAGKETVRYLTSFLRPYNVTSALQRNFKTSNNTGKLAKQEILSSVAADKTIKVFMDLGNKKWNEALFDEFEKMPNGKHDDQIDAVYDGYNFLTSKSATRLSLIHI